MQAAVILFPGSNCDRDMEMALTQAMGRAPLKIWHQETTLPKVDLITIPGGFSYGDYLRCGAMAVHSPIMSAIMQAAKKGTKILGVCNGFQILTESGLLPGALIRNKHLNFICKAVNVRVESNDNPFLRGYKKGQVVNFPIAHHDGQYILDKEQLKGLEDHQQIALRYADLQGGVNDTANPNGSVSNIAGIFNKDKTILGMMPHPERHIESQLGGVDGCTLFNNLVEELG